MLDDYFRNYGVLTIFLAIAIIVPISLLGISYAASFIKVRPVRPTSIKQTAYESGMKPFSPRPARFNFRYYYYALLFVVFDVETVLLYPWAVKYGALSAEFGWFALGAVFVFLFIATVAYVYAWRKNALEWVSGQ